ncbi:MAG TPA: hypothetical protein VIP98_16690 [Microlunatus sp.]
MTGQTMKWPDLDQLAQRLAEVEETPPPVALAQPVVRFGRFEAPAGEVSGVLLGGVWESVRPGTLEVDGGSVSFVDGSGRRTITKLGAVGAVRMRQR